jgi:hypothetical protein
MNIFPVKRGYKISAQFHKNFMCQIIIGMFQIFNLSNNSSSFIEIRLSNQLFKFFAHCGCIVCHIFKKVVEYFILGNKDFHDSI